MQYYVQVVPKEVQPITAPQEDCKGIMHDWIQRFKLAGIREKVDRSRSMGSTIALIFSTKDSNSVVRSVEGFLGTPLLTLA